MFMDGAGRSLEPIVFGILRFNLETDHFPSDGPIFLLPGRAENFGGSAVPKASTSGFRCAERGTNRRPILGGNPRPECDDLPPSVSPFQPIGSHFGRLGQNGSRFLAGSLFPRSEGLHPSLGDGALAGL